MMHQPGRPQSPQSPAGPAPDGREFAASLIALMDEFLATAEKETELVGAGKLAAAGDLAAAKTEIAGRYLAASLRFKEHAATWRAQHPQVFAALQQRHEAFRDRLQKNLTVLATAHAVSEGLIRGAAGEVARKNVPQGYGAGGQAAAPPPHSARPVAFSQAV